MKIKGKKTAKVRGEKKEGERKLYDNLFKLIQSLMNSVHFSSYSL